jgi:hypothetical protein
MTRLAPEATKIFFLRDIVDHLSREEQGTEAPFGISVSEEERPPFNATAPRIRRGTSPGPPRSGPSRVPGSQSKTTVFSAARFRRRGGGP